MDTCWFIVYQKHPSEGVRNCVTTRRPFDWLIAMVEFGPCWIVNFWTISGERYTELSQAAAWFTDPLEI
jgi:hypothetical protein